MKKRLIGSGLIAGVIVATVVWRTPFSSPITRPSTRAAVEAPFASQPEPAHSSEASSRATSNSSAATAFEKSVAPPAPSGDFELSVSDTDLQAIVEARYGAFVRSLTLPPTTRDRLYELLTERQHAAIDVANAAMVAGLNPIRDLPLIQRAIALAEADVDVDIAREHGAVIAAACREFESGRTEQRTVEQLTRALADTAEPLAPAQQERLVEILRRSSTSTASADINSAIFGRLYRRPSIGAATFAAATAELSPAQLDVLRQLAQANASIP